MQYNISDNMSDVKGSIIRELFKLAKDPNMIAFGGGNPSPETFPVDEIAENGHELTVVACLEILPREIVVLGLRSIGCEHITKHILLTRKLLEILVKPYGPSA